MSPPKKAGPGAVAAASEALGELSAKESPQHVANATPQRQHNSDIGDVLTALAAADRAPALGLYNAARLHLLRAARYAIRWPS